MRQRYTKMIGDQQIISYCTSLYIDGHWVSNPTQEQIFADGWAIFVPPVIPPQPQLDPDYGSVLEAVKKMFSAETEEMTDEEALEVAALYPTLISKIGKEVEAGERLWWDGRLWKTTQYINKLLANWTPDTAVSLFTLVSIEEWPAWVQPTGAQDAYALGAHVSHVDKHWESLVDNNVWEPGATGTENLWQEIQS